jgi:transposase
MEFLKEWSQHINPNSGIYYDITSISSYSDNITVLENGYNRDKEYLPQVNMGIIHCSKSNLPISYNLYPGSIVDVSTLKNNIKLFNLFELKDLFLILDRGFCSIANMIDMVKNNMIFIQPLSYSLNKARNLIEKNKENIIKSDNIFKYKEEILYHLKDQMELDNKTKLDCHIIYNEKQAISFKHNLYSNLIDIEQKQLDLNNNDIKLNNIIFSDKISAQKYIENNIISKYQKFFTILEKKNKSNNSKISYQIIRDNKEIENAIFRSGSFILATNKKDIGNIEIIDCYRNRDSVEKDIDSLKNHLDSKRLRSHNKDTANGKLFIKFISLILYNYINKNIKKNKKLKHNSFKEILLELKKLKINSFDKNKQFLTEISKKQKLIFNTMNIKESDIENMVIK